jgi:hypothetical protein
VIRAWQGRPAGLPKGGAATPPCRSIQKPLRETGAAFLFAKYCPIITRSGFGTGQGVRLVLPVSLTKVSKLIAAQHHVNGFWLQGFCLKTGFKLGKPDA